MTQVSIVIPTYKRPDDIVRALKSLFKLDLVGSNIGTLDVKVIVADNDPNGGAHAAVSALANNAPIPVIYVHVPEPGVSNARNGAMAHVSGRYVAFLDDDMEATPPWLCELINTSQRLRAGIVFGPAIARMPTPDTHEHQLMKPLFSRTMDAPEGVTTRTFGTGGCLLDLSLCDMPIPAFDPSLNEVGGEDDYLFGYLMARGTVVGWSPKAVSYEHVPARRATASYLWERHFAFGQGPTQIAADKGVMGAPSVIKWMCVGVVQAAIFAPLYAGLSVLQRPMRLTYLARTAEGLGKILWWNGFSPRLYGTSNKAS